MGLSQMFGVLAAQFSKWQLEIHHGLAVDLLLCTLLVANSHPFLSYHANFHKMRGILLDDAWSEIKAKGRRQGNWWSIALLKAKEVINKRVDMRKNAQLYCSDHDMVLSLIILYTLIVANIIYISKMWIYISIDICIYRLYYIYLYNTVRRICVV